MTQQTTHQPGSECAHCGLTRGPCNGKCGVPVQQTTAFYRLTAGRMCWHAIRDVVSYAKHQGASISLWEGSGWIERNFEIRGDPAAVAAVQEALVLWERKTRA